MKKDTLAVKGMTCAACASAVEKSVCKVAGVAHANVNLAAEKLHVEYDDTVDLEAIKAAVERAGYEVAEEAPAAQRITIPISGMTCAACAAAVERAVGRLPGVREVSVNLAAEQAQVVYDPAEVRLSAVKDAIVKAGYEPLEAQSEQVDEHQERRLAGSGLYGSAFCFRRCLRHHCFTSPWGICWACQSQASCRRS